MTNFLEVPTNDFPLALRTARRFVSGDVSIRYAVVRFPFQALRIRRSCGQWVMAWGQALPFAPFTVLCHRTSRGKRQEARLGAREAEGRPTKRVLRRAAHVGYTHVGYSPISARCEKRCLVRGPWNRPQEKRIQHNPIRHGDLIKKVQEDLRWRWPPEVQRSRMRGAVSVLSAAYCNCPAVSI